MLLTKLQSIIYFELSESPKPLTGYDLTKSINSKGLTYSHQQVYRELKNMPLTTEHVPQLGKPAKILKSIDTKADVEINCEKWPIELFVAYPHKEFIEHKKAHIKNQMKLLDSHIQSIVGRGGAETPNANVLIYKLEQLDFNLNKLNQLSK